MKATIKHVGFGTLEFEESFFTGARTLRQNGSVVEKQGKKEYLLSDGERTHRCTMEGNSILGVRLVTEGGERIALTPALRWYEVVIAVAIFAVMVVWGNSVTLCSIIPVVGGAIGGGVTGACIVLGFVFSKRSDRTAIKLLIWLGILAATFLICAVIGIFLVVLLAAR